MSRLNDALQGLLETARSGSRAHAVLLRVRSEDGRVDFKGGAGATTPEARFPIASIAKTYTATLIQQLFDEGRLDPDQTVQSALPRIDLSGLHVINGVAHGPRLTIRQLLCQTSGLADYYEGGVAEDLVRSRDRAYDLQQVLAWAKARAPQAAPDSGKAHYSDTNYQLLGAVIEAVMGTSYADALQERICAPLGLTRTAVFDATRDGNGQTLPVYHGTLRLDVPHILSSMGPDGGIVSDTDELMIFLRACMSGRLFRPAGMPSLRRWRRLSFPLEYGGGLMRFRLPGWMTLWRPSPELIGHSGASGSFAFHAPERDIFVVGTFNQTDAPRRPFNFILQVLNTLEKHGGTA
jgi:CubicO group peptidase (beta-lactamase class C family)